MSYGAYVICNCFKNGKTKEPPHKEFLRFDIDDPYLDIPDDLWEKDENKAYQMEAEFYEWKQTACEHEEMELIYENFSNISGMAAFRDIMNKLGGIENFPILTKYLPKTNDGILPAKFAQQALNELLLLEKEFTLEEKVELIEKSTGIKIASTNKNSDWLFVFAKNDFTFGIDRNGFFIQKIIKGIPTFMFRSVNFIQKTISQTSYKFTDIKSGKSFECSIELYSNVEEATKDYEFEVINKKVVIANEYEYIIKPLIKVMKASVNSGNPVHWS